MAADCSPINENDTININQDHALLVDAGAVHEGDPGHPNYNYAFVVNTSEIGGPSSTFRRVRRTEGKMFI